MAHAKDFLLCNKSLCVTDVSDCVPQFNIRIMPYSEYSRIVQGWRKANINLVTSSLIINQYLLGIYEIILICFSNIDIAWAQLISYYIWWWFTSNLLMHFHESFFLINFSCHHVSLFRWMMAFYILHIHRHETLSQLYLLILSHIMRMHVQWLISVGINNIIFLYYKNDSL